MAAFEADEWAAWKKYRGRPIEVTGTLDEIGAEASQHPTLWLHLPVTDNAPAFTSHGPASDEMRASVGHRVRLWCARADHAGAIPYLYDCALADQSSSYDGHFSLMAAFHAK